MHAADDMIAAPTSPTPQSTYRTGVSPNTSAAVLRAHYSQKVKTAGLTLTPHGNSHYLTASATSTARSRESSISYYHTANESSRPNSVGQASPTMSARREKAQMTKEADQDSLDSSERCFFLSTRTKAIAESPAVQQNDGESGDESDVSSSCSCDDEEERVPICDIARPPRKITRVNAALMYSQRILFFIIQRPSELSIELAPAKTSLLRRIQHKIKAFVDGDHFTRGILVAILINTLSMGIEYHDQVVCMVTRAHIKIFPAASLAH